MKIQVAIVSSLLQLMMSLPAPEAEARANNIGAGHIALDSTYILPLLLAGAAFAKGYLFGNLKGASSIGQYGYGYERSYGYPYGHYDYYGRRLGTASPDYYYGTNFQVSQDTGAESSNQYATWPLKYNY